MYDPPCSSHDLILISISSKLWKNRTDQMYWRHDIAMCTSRKMMVIWSGQRGKKLSHVQICPEDETKDGSRPFGESKLWTHVVFSPNLILSTSQHASRADQSRSDRSKKGQINQMIYDKLHFSNDPGRILNVQEFQWLLWDHCRRRNEDAQERGELVM